MNARIILVCLLVLGCEPAPETFEVIDRDDDSREPLSAECDDIDAARCLLPWPSNTFTVEDATETGLRLAIDPVSISPRDDASALARADGFSRVTPILTAFDAPLDEATIAAGFHLVLMQHDHPERGHEVPLEIQTVVLETGETLVAADPREVLEADADYAVVITDDLRHADGSVPSRSRTAALALELVTPASEQEAHVVGHYAPVRRLIEELDLELSHVVRAWDFTTRSEENARAPLVAMRQASIDALDGATAIVDRVQFPEDARIAMIVEGRLTGMPTFLADGGGFVLGDDGTPIVQGTTDAPFRILVPAGTGDWRFVMYGHGTGGNEYDDAFDTDLAEHGVGKVNVRFYGWTDLDTLTTFTGLMYAFQGSFAAAASLVEALAHAAAIQYAMEGVIGEALSAETIASMPNPAAGRRPDASIPVWVGGSLGGTTGLVYASADPNVRYAILNVPGAAWGQWVWNSAAFELIHGVLIRRYESEIDLFMALAIGQTNLDMADGTAWVDVLREHPTAFLIQESIGDPIMPNQATEMVAITAGARMVAGAIEPIPGIEPADEVIDGSAITQFRTAFTEDLQIHGFADREGPAGDAAREQIRAFLESAWDGESRIAVPSTCAASCDFGP